MKIVKDKRHLNNLKEILDFLNRNDISFEIDKKDNRIFHLNEGKIQLRYVDSENHKMDYSKRFNIKGIDHDYFVNITKDNRENGIRTIWIKDWEIEEHKTIVNIDGKELKDYRRKWNVLKSYITTAVGKIDKDKRFYARDCEVGTMTNKEIRPFLEENCFYGYRSSNTNLKLFLKKDKNGLKKNTLLMVYTFGHPFFSKGLYDVEVIRVATKLNCQVIGGASKLLRHFMLNYPTLEIGKKTVNVNKIVFIVDADHNDGRSLEKLGFEFVSHRGHGFMNVDTTTGEVFHRKPMQHKLIMEKMSKGEIYSVANAGSIIYYIDRNKYLEELEKKGYKIKKKEKIDIFFN